MFTPTPKTPLAQTDGEGSENPFSVKRRRLMKPLALTTGTAAVLTKHPTKCLEAPGAEATVEGVELSPPNEATDDDDVWIEIDDGDTADAPILITD